MPRTPRIRPQMPAGEIEPEGPPQVALWILVSLALWLLIIGAVWSLWPQPTFNDRWPTERFHPFISHQGQLPRAPLMPWWIERVIV